MCEGIADEPWGIDLGDKRLNQRSKRVIEALAANPESSINASCEGSMPTRGVDCVEVIAGVLSASATPCHAWDVGFLAGKRWPALTTRNVWWLAQASFLGLFPREVRDNFHWRDLRGLGKLLASVFAIRFPHARSTRWKCRRKCRRSSSPSR